MQAGHRRLYQPKPAQAEAALVAVDDAAVGGQHLRLQRVERLGAVAGRPPRLRRGQRQAHLVSQAGGAGVFGDERTGRIEQPMPHGAARGEGAVERGANVNARAQQVVGQPDRAGHFGDAQVVCFEADALPRPGGQQRRAPVPAVVVRRLAHVEAAGVAVPQRSGAVVGLEFAAAPQGAVETDPERVRAGREPPADVDAQRREHVVRRRQRLAVEPDAGEGVEAVEGQRQRFARGVGRDLEGQPVAPVALGHPLHVGLVAADPGVGDGALLDQVAVDRARHCGCAPPRVATEGLGVARRRVGDAELPAAVKGLRVDGACHGDDSSRLRGALRSSRRKSRRAAGRSRRRRFHRRDPATGRRRWR